MKVSGFSIVRNAIRYSYPVAEALRSVAPLVDELVVAVGKGDDGTLELIRSLDLPGLRIIETVWDEALRVGGKVLAQQTNLALAECRHPWAFYIQADEVVHEADQPRIRASLQRWGDDPSVDALSFRFVHFEGTYDFVNVTRYRKQCRLVRNDGRLQSVGDAAGFARRDGGKLRTRPSGARIYHYGWVRAPDDMRTKQIAFQKLYHDDATVQRRWGDVAGDDFSDVEIAFRFRGTHPAVMRERIARFDYDVPRSKRPPLDSPWLSPKFYAEWLKKWHILKRR